MVFRKKFFCLHNNGYDLKKSLVDAITSNSESKDLFLIRFNSISCLQNVAICSVGVLNYSRVRKIKRGDADFG